MAVEIFGVDKNSLAERAGIKPHDKLVSINGHDITDILDFRFYETNTHLHVVYETAEGERREEKFVKPQYGALGLAFETYLMDRQRSCRNKCVFCFIDQLPPGMRETLYFKDDDDRLSFFVRQLHHADEH
ncbi:MAG: PDZ domain-containing protein [Hominenteromicrobium sp.]|uniref:PDZ domain-containing protein n=1 Tax=Hominenteromicrobium sp. TaxID=3073581 RepID=UPI00399FD6B9